MGTETISFWINPVEWHLQHSMMSIVEREKMALLPCYRTQTLPMAYPVVSQGRQRDVR